MPKPALGLVPALGPTAVRSLVVHKLALAPFARVVKVTMTKTRTRHPAPQHAARQSRDLDGPRRASARSQGRSVYPSRSARWYPGRSSESDSIFDSRGTNCGATGCGRTLR